MKAGTVLSASAFQEWCGGTVRESVTLGTRWHHPLWLGNAKIVWEPETGLLYAYNYYASRVVILGFYKTRKEVDAAVGDVWRTQAPPYDLLPVFVRCGVAKSVTEKWEGEES